MVMGFGLKFQVRILGLRYGMFGYGLRIRTRIAAVPCSFTAWDCLEALSDLIPLGI